MTTFCKTKSKNSLKIVHSKILQKNDKWAEWILMEHSHIYATMFERDFSNCSSLNNLEISKKIRSSNVVRMYIQNWFQPIVNWMPFCGQFKNGEKYRKLMKYLLYKNAPLKKLACFINGTIGQCIFTSKQVSLLLHLYDL